MISTPGMAPIAAYLKAQVTELKSVETAAAFFAAAEGNIATPAAYVLPVATSADPNSVAAGQVRQRLTETFAVALFFGRAGAKGEHAVVKFEPVRDAILTALVGWKHPDGGTAIEVVRQQLTRYDAENQIFGWQIDFRFRHHISNL